MELGLKLKDKLLLQHSTMDNTKTIAELVDGHGNWNWVLLNTILGHDTLA